MELILSTRDAAKFFGVTTKCLTNDWKKAGCPQLSRGRWDLKAVHDWWFENIAADRAASRAGNDSLAEAKKKYWWNMAELKQLDLEVANGKYIRVTDVEAEAEHVFGELNSILNALPSRLAPKLMQRESLPEIQRILEDGINQAKQTFQDLDFSE